MGASMGGCQGVPALAQGFAGTEVGTAPVATGCQSMTVPGSSREAWIVSDPQQLGGHPTTAPGSPT